MKEWNGTVHANREIGTYKVLTIAVPSSFEEPKAGAFAMIDCGFMIDGTILRRPMAFYDFRKNGDQNLVDILYHVVGKGTGLMSKMQIGQKVEFLGPLGNSFSTPDAHQKIWIVAGGIGIAPFLIWLKQIKHLNNVKILFGFKDDHQLAICEDFDSYKKFLTTCVQHGDQGNYKGTVVDLLKEKLQFEKPDLIFTCGPTIMMDKTIEVAKDHDIPVEVSLEAKMGCGIGVCLSCVTPLQHRNQNGTFSLVCKDGPIFTV